MRVLSLKRDLNGVIRLTCAEPTVPRIMATGLLDRFQVRYPNLRVEFVTSDRYLDLNGGDADVAFRSGEPIDETLVGSKICDSAWAIYASKSYVPAHGRPADIEDLADHAMIGFDGKPPRGEVAPGNIVSRNNSMLGTLAAVNAGVGVAPLPTTLGDGRLRGWLRSSTMCLMTFRHCGEH